jgi:hypothetical protein
MDLGVASNFPKLILASESPPLKKRANIEVQRGVL